MRKPKVVQHDSVEDVQTIGNVLQMYQKFVTKIDHFRSISNAPGLGVNTAQFRGQGELELQGRRALGGLDVDSSKFVESRAHAFYRMIGFPVAVQSGYFYNPGHDPNQGVTLTHRSNVDNALNAGNAGVVRLSQLRETQFKKRRNVFAKQDDVSITYAILLRNTKQFLMAKTGEDPFFEDQQTKAIAGRDIDLDLININGSSVPLFIYKNVSHILKPFIVIPEIEISVTPNFERRICVPFLPDIESTKSSPDHTLKRPILEYIIKQRLKATGTDTVFVKEAERLLQNSTEATTSTNSGVRTILLALSGQDSLSDVNNEIIDAIQGFTSVQSSTVAMLTKAIRVAIIELDDSVRKMDALRASHNIQIVPDQEGPEFGGTIRTIGGVDELSREQRRAALMKLTGMISHRQSQIQERFIGNESVYAAAVVADVAKDFTPEVTKEERKRDEFGRQAIQLLKIIEIVTGEVSGLGLVDILAIYTALWAIDIEYLIGFLDDPALARLEEYFPELVNDDVRSQINGSRPGIVATLQEFEKLLFNILTYADKVLVQTRQTPRLARKGSIT